MNLKQTRLHILHKPKDLGKEAKTGVSLHCHTLHSKEMLDFVPYYAAKIPIVSYFWEKECRRYFEREGKLPNFSTGYWSPPLTGHEVYQSEKEQINQAGLEAVVSITDHDCIEANLEVNQQIPNSQAPISMEWTVPFEYAFLHVGVHNLPPKRAVEITEQLLNYSFSSESPDNKKLHEIFAMLNEIPEILVVLNHPVWDIEMIGDERHLALLKHFVAEHGKWIHAFEVNGFRSWSENQAVIEMAETLGFPLVTGGDRHCCHTNTVINLTNSKTFAEFAEEIRVDKYSEVVLMPEYREPLHSRQISSIAEILKNYPEFPEGRRRWFDRVHIDVEDNSGLRPLSFHWKGGGPKWLRWAMWAVGILGHKSMRPAFRLAMKQEDRVPKQITNGRPQSTIIGEPLATNVH
ncbi:MAG TPA: hypothetical protein VNI60_07890 [Pyrinomonadaceae bacterium]|nr:hypothetical protein [Pyrinomonadaceae bacterium]